MKNKVYIVTAGDYSDYSIYGAFSSYEKAEEWIGKAQGYSIEEHELDHMSDKRLIRLSCSMDMNGDNASFREIEYHGELDRIISINRFPPTIHMNFTADTDKKHAIKALNEKRAQIIALYSGAGEIKFGYYDRDTLVHYGWDLRGRKK